MTKDYPPDAVVMCVLASEPACFADDAFSPCADCGRQLRHRPYVPAHVRKLCLMCVEAMLATTPSPETVKFSLAGKTLQELALFYSKGRKQ